MSAMCECAVFLVTSSRKHGKKWTCEDRSVWASHWHAVRYVQNEVETFLDEVKGELGNFDLLPSGAYEARVKLKNGDKLSYIVERLQIHGDTR